MGENLDIIYKIVETNWGTWKSMYPDSKVLTTKTGYDRNYQSYAYGEEYQVKDELIYFPPRYPNDTRLDAKTRVHGIMPDDTLHEDASVRVYDINKFGEGISVLHDEFKGEKFVLVGSSSYNFAAAFRSTLSDSTELSFDPVKDNLPVVMKDQEGNKWNVFGEAVEGPRKGQTLPPVKSYTGYWFGMRDIFHRPDIYEFE